MVKLEVELISFTGYEISMTEGGFSTMKILGALLFHEFVFPLHSKALVCCIKGPRGNLSMLVEHGRAIVRGTRFKIFRIMGIIFRHCPDFKQMIG